MGAIQEGGSSLRGRVGDKRVPVVHCGGGGGVGGGSVGGAGWEGGGWEKV